MHIRPATAEDVPGVLPMVEKIVAQHAAIDAGRYAALDDVLDRYAAWLPQRATDPLSVFLVTDAGSSTSAVASTSPTSLAGFTVAGVEKNIPIYRIAEFGFIFDLWVEPPHRKHGVARALVLETLRRFERMGVTQVRLDTAAPNEAARNLFTSLGFRVGTVDMLKDI